MADVWGEDEREVSNVSGGGNNLPMTVEDGQDGSGLKARVKEIGGVNRMAVDALQRDEDDERLRNSDAFTLGIEYVLNNGQTVDHSFQTPAAPTQVKFRFKTYSADRSEIQLWEAPTIGAYNFSWTPRNRDRVTNAATGATVQAISTTTSPGSYVTKESNYAAGLSTHPSLVKFSQWYLLAPGTEYMIRMRSYAASNLTTVQLQWYEE